jgi:Cu/Ag efflux protein CusF
MGVPSMATLVLCLGLGCGSPPGEGEVPAAQAEQSDEQRYDLKGKVVAVDVAGKKLTVDHEDIPGFMAAMTMAYPVKDEKLLESLSAGDEVTATVVSGDGGYWLEDIAVATSSPPAP